MPEPAVFKRALAEPLNRRRTLSVELPDFVLRALDMRVDDANQGADEDPVDVNDVIEWLLVSELTVATMARYEHRIPGFSAAVFAWLMTAHYQPDET